MHDPKVTAKIQIDRYNGWLETQSIRELRKECKRRGIPISHNELKHQYIELLRKKYAT